MDKIDKGDRGTYHTNNKVNELTSKEWLKFTKSWFIHNPTKRKLDEVMHPAKYPESMIKEFINFFTKPNATVLDPFLGTGSTLIACHETGRNGIGVELLYKYSEIALNRVKAARHQQLLEGGKHITHQKVINADARNISQIWVQEQLPDIDFVITSPPYGNMLQKKGLAQDKRGELDTKYSNSEEDLGNIEDPDTFISSLVDVFVKIKQFMAPRAYLVVIIQNYMDGNEYRPLAWDLGKELSKHFKFRGEKLWCQDNKTLYPYGYRYGFVPNVHHHYCLIFRKD